MVRVRGRVALALLVAAGGAACDTGDGKTLAPPPPTTAPVATSSTIPPTPEVTFLDGFGDLLLRPGDQAGEGRELGFAVTLCRWVPQDAPAGEVPVLTVTGNGVTTDGDRFSLTLEGFRSPDGALQGRADLSFTSGPLWQGRGPDGGPVALQIDEQAQGLAVRADLEITDIRPGGTRPTLGPATVDITCL